MESSQDIEAEAGLKPEGEEVGGEEQSPVVTKLIEHPKPIIYDMSPVPTGPVAVKASLTHKYTLKDSIKNVFAAKFSPDGNYIAASFADGSVHVHTTFKGDRVFTPKIQKMLQDEHSCPVPRDQDLIKPIITALCWRPCNVEE
jgi:WD40 repeat protein